MEEIKDFINENKTIIFIVLEIIIVVFLVLGELFLYAKINTKQPQIIKEVVAKEQQQENQSKEYVYVDIKGEIKTPGMYKLEKGKRVQDAVLLAGGLTKNANTKANNLSKQLTDEMVIIIYDKNAITNFEEIKQKEEQVEIKCETASPNIINDTCVETEEPEIILKGTEDEKKYININLASKEELMTLSGLGESKATAIIEYRQEHKFLMIEELKEVSGIGDSTYDKIKEDITI